MTICTSSEAGYLVIWEVRCNTYFVGTYLGASIPSTGKHLPGPPHTFHYFLLTEQDTNTYLSFEHFISLLPYHGVTSSFECETSSHRIFSLFSLPPAFLALWIAPWSLCLIARQAQKAGAKPPLLRLPPPHSREKEKRAIEASWRVSESPREPSSPSSPSSPSNPLPSAPRVWSTVLDSLPPLWG